MKRLRQNGISGVGVGIAVAVFLSVGAPAAVAGDPMIQRIDHLIDHVSQAPGNAVEAVKLFVRERVLSPVAGGDGPREAVLMVPAFTVGPAAMFDVDYQDYSWAEALARSGFDVFMLDLTGYGFSPKPEMDDPCNVNPAQQNLLVTNPLTQECTPAFAKPIMTSESEWAEMDTAVDFIRDHTGVDRVHLIGWSAGGPRAGGYAARHQDKVGRVVLVGPDYIRDTPNEPGPAEKESPFAMRLLTAQSLADRWNPEVLCDDQLDPAVRHAIWAANIATDPVGASWGSPPYDPIKSPLGGVARGGNFANRTGWNREAAARIEAPVLIITGEYDRGPDGPWPDYGNLYEDLVTPNKTMVTVACASHWLVYERAHNVLHALSIEWLKDGTVLGRTNGVLNVDNIGRLVE